MRTFDFGIPGIAIDADRDSVAARRSGDALGVETKVNTFTLQNVEDRGRDFFIFAADQARPHFDDGDPAAKAPEHLRELEADIAATDDDQMLGQKVDVHHGGVGEEVYLIETGHFRDNGAAADIEEDALGSKPPVAHAHLM